MGLPGRGLNGGREVKTASRKSPILSASFNIDGYASTQPSADWNWAAVENDELQEILLEKEAERRERSTANENESVIEKMIHDFMKDKLVDRSTDVLKYWEDNRLLKHQLYVLAKVKILNNKTFVSIFTHN